MYWGVMVLAGLLLGGGPWLSLSKLPSGWRFTWVVLAIVPLVALVQFATRIFAPWKIQGRLDRLTIPQRFALYRLHYLAVIAFFFIGGVRICIHFVPGAHNRSGFLPLLWITCILLVICIADLSGTTANVWRPIKPTGSEEK
jgi:hypothetical protein